jgi:hypothetical protein
MTSLLRVLLFLVLVPVLFPVILRVKILKSLPLLDPHLPCPEARHRLLTERTQQYPEHVKHYGASSPIWPTRTEKGGEILEKSSVNEILQDSLLRSPLSDKVFGLSLQKVQEEVIKTPQPLRVNVQLTNGKRSGTDC